MNDLTEYRDNLPATAEDLQKFILIGKESLKAQKAKIRAIEKANMAFAAKEAALQDTQDIADILLDAEVKLGEMLEEIKPKYVGSIPGTHVPKQEKTLPSGITKKESHEAQEIAKHPDIVQQVKDEARQEGRVPTSRDVYQKIQDEKVKKEEKIEEDSNNLFQLKLYWHRANKKDRKRFMKWVKNNNKKEV